MSALRARVQTAAAGLLVSPRTRELRRRLARRERAGRGGRRVLRFFHQVEDASSLLLAQALPRFLDAFDVDLEVIVVPAPSPGADPEPAMRIAWLARDARELARFLELDMPEGPGGAPDPALADTAAAIALVERPAADQLAALASVGRALFAGDAARMEELARELGRVDASRVAPMLEAGRARLERAGHYQGGMIAYESEWYWGIDRLSELADRLRDEGLEPTGEPLVPRRADAHPPALEGVERDAQGRPVLEMFFSFRSPYSYIALLRARRMCDEVGARLRVRPVLPMVMRGLPVPRAKRFYIVRDVKRAADRQGIPFGRIVDPVGVGVERCMALYFHAEERDGGGAAFAEAAARGIWSRAIDVASDAGLERVAAEVGLDRAAVRAALADEGWRESVEANRQALTALGLWGVPSFRLGSWSTWGQDRLWLVEERLRRLGA